MATRKRHVLCAVDYSACSRAALRYASAAAQQIDATLTVLNVADPLLVATMQTFGVTDWPAPEREELRREWTRHRQGCNPRTMLTRRSVSQTTAIDSRQRQPAAAEEFAAM